MANSIRNFLYVYRGEFIFVLLALIFIGLRFWIYFKRAPIVLEKKESYVGVIDGDPEDKDRFQVFPILLSGNGNNNSGEEIRVRVYVPRHPKYEYGDEIRIHGYLSPPRSFKSDNDRIFDYKHFLSKDSIYYEVKNPIIEVVSKRKGSSVVTILLALKHAFLSHIKSVLGEPHSSLAGGLVVGEKSALGNELIDDFRRAGLIHIVVLSGYNITIVASAIRRMLAFLPRKTSIVLGGIAMILFCILVGGGATVVRSCIMAMIGLSAELTYKKYKAGRALAITAYIMVWHNPDILLYDPSFQLSFLATLALILLSTPIDSILEKISPWCERVLHIPRGLARYVTIPEKFGIRGLVATTLATQIFVSPFIFYLMGQISIIGVIVNIVVLPIIPVTMFVVTAIGLGGYISVIVSSVFAIPAHMLLSYELWVVHVSAHLPFAVLTITSFSFTTMCVVYLCYFGIWIYFVAASKFFSITSQLRLAKKSST